MLDSLVRVQDGSFEALFCQSISNVHFADKKHHKRSALKRDKQNQWFLENHLCLHKNHLRNDLRHKGVTPPPPPLPPLTPEGEPRNQKEKK